MIVQRRCTSCCSSVENIPLQAERHSARRQKLFAFPPESAFTFRTECCSESQRNRVRLQSGIAFTFDRIPHNAKPAIDALLEQEPDEVVDIKRNVRPKKGGRFGFDAGEEGKIATALSDFLTEEGDIPVSEGQIRRLLRRSGASDVVLIWKRLQILTRVALIERGPEFLFIWRDSGPSSTVVDTVLRKVASYEKLLARPDINRIRTQLFAMPRDQVLRPALAAQQHAVSRHEIMEIIGLALAKGDFEPRFRVNTDYTLIDFANIWRRDLTEFPSTVVDEKGRTLDLTVPSNIEVAFQRVR